MKTFLLRRLVVVTATLLLATSVRGDEASYSAIVKERDHVLSQILAAQESSRSTGLADDDAIAAAQLTLYSFRRDVANDPAQKIKQQELVVGVHEKKFKYAEAMQKTGTRTYVGVLETKAALLEAQQRLEELRLKR